MNMVPTKKIDPLIETPSGLYERDHVLNRLDRLLDRFQRKANSRGLDIAIETYDEARYNDKLNKKKWAWIEKNVEMHRLPKLNPWSTSTVRPEPVPDTAYEVIPEPQPLAPAPETAVNREITAIVTDIYTLLGAVADKLEQLRDIR